MYNLTLALFISMQAMAGVGGVAGGNVLFQKHSVYVSPTNRTLCHDGVSFRAVIEKCTKWSNLNPNSCASTAEIEIFQPIVGVQKICVGNDSATCSEWGEMPFIQNPSRKVDLVDLNSRVRGTSTILVPRCF